MAAEFKRWPLIADRNVCIFLFSWRLVEQEVIQAAKCDSSTSCRNSCGKNFQGSELNTGHLLVAGRIVCAIMSIREMLVHVFYS